MTVKVFGKCKKCNEITELIASDAEEGQTLLYNNHGIEEHCSFEGKIHIDEIPSTKPVFSFVENGDSDEKYRNRKNGNGNGNGKKRR